MTELTEEAQTKLLAIKAAIVKEFDQEMWLELGAITGTLNIIRNHDRLIRSLSWRDPDYPGNALAVLIRILEADPQNLRKIEKYIRERVNVDAAAENISTAGRLGRSVVFTPSVFTLPDGGVEKDLVAVMMPFQPEFDEVYNVIDVACVALGLRAQRADNIWQDAVVIQDIFSLIFRSYAVVADFTNKNPNVFYETGIAHTLGKHVVPIAQSDVDVPFDLRHHRYFRYLNNQEGRQQLGSALFERLKYLKDLGD